jgi:hypothetical protein
VHLNKPVEAMRAIHTCALPHAPTDREKAHHGSVSSSEGPERRCKGLATNAPEPTSANRAVPGAVRETFLVGLVAGCQFTAALISRICVNATSPADRS